LEDHEWTPSRGMSSSKKIPELERWQIVLYIRSLQAGGSQ
jgi:hypothetical protein